MPPVGSTWGIVFCVLIKLYITQPIVRGRTINLQGSWTWILFTYEKLHKLCFHCGRINHGISIDACNRTLSTKENAQFGMCLWTRTSQQITWGSEIFGNSYKLLDHIGPNVRAQDTMAHSEMTPHAMNQMREGVGYTNLGNHGDYRGPNLSKDSVHSADIMPRDLNIPRIWEAT